MLSVIRIVLFNLVLSGFLISHAQAQTATSILLFGDSIIAGYGLSEPDSLAVKLEESLKAKGKNIKVINGGVSGDTTTSARSRLEWVLKKNNPDIILIALGGNDVLRGFQPEITRDNLDAMLSIAKKQKIRIILSKVQAPANFGIDYMNKFNAIYPDLAKKYDVPPYPFLLEDTFNKSALMQSDQIHPNAEGIKIIADLLSKYLLKFLGN